MDKLSELHNLFPYCAHPVPYRAIHVGGFDDFNVVFIGAGNIMFGMSCHFLPHIRHHRILDRIGRRPMEPFLPF